MASSCSLTSPSERVVNLTVQPGCEAEAWSVTFWSPEYGFFQRVLYSKLGIYAFLAFLTCWAYVSGFETVMKFYIAPYLVTNGWLVLYTWLHHTHPDVPHMG